MSVAVLILILCVLVAVWSWMRPRYPLPPLYPGALPIIGHGHLLIGDSINLWKRLVDLFDYSLEKGGLVEFRIGPLSTYVLSDPDDSLVVANSCLDKPYIYEFGKNLYNRGLVTANVPLWKTHRKLLNPVFNQHMLNTFVGEFNAQARSLVSQVSSEVGKGPFDVHSHLINFGLKNIIGTSLGLSTEDRYIIDKDYAEASDAMFTIFATRLKKVWLHPSFLYNRSSLKRKENEIIKIKKNIIRAVIDKRKTELKTKNKSNNDDTPRSGKFKPLLDQLLNLAETQNAFTDEEIMEHLETFVVAAYDSTATVMMYTLLLIGSNLDIQERVYNELQQVLGDQDRDLTKDDLPKLVYLEVVLKESLRLYPSAPFIARIHHTDVKLKNYTLPAGKICVISLYSINRHSMWGTDANQFRPERWLDPATMPDNPNAFVSFSVGRRNCIGKLYSMMAMKTALARFLRRYHVTSDISNLESQWEIILRPVVGNHISITLR